MVKSLAPNPDGRGFKSHRRFQIERMNDDKL